MTNLAKASKDKLIGNQFQHNGKTYTCTTHSIDEATGESYLHSFKAKFLASECQEVKKTTKGIKIGDKVKLFTYNLAKEPNQHYGKTGKVVDIAKMYGETSLFIQVAGIANHLEVRPTQARKTR